MSSNDAVSSAIRAAERTRPRSSVGGCPRVANDEVHVLAEGPFWDPVLQRLMWVDISHGLVLVGRLHDDGTITVEDRVAFPGTVGAVAVTQSGDWVVAGPDRLFWRYQSGAVGQGPAILSGDGARRLNDGKPDPLGRFVVGSLSLAGPSSTELLVVTSPDGAVRHVVDNGLTLSNGLAWSADGSVLYNVDTVRGVIFARPYDVASGETGPATTAVSVADGSPDGMCMDAEGHLWVAIWGLGQVHRYTTDGELVQVIEVPAPHTSCVAFAGPALDTLVITTATQDLDARELVAFPHSGKVFTIRPGVRGLPQALWSGPEPSTSEL